MNCWPVSAARVLLWIISAAALAQCKGAAYAPPVEMVPDVTAEIAEVSSGFLAVRPPEASGAGDKRPLAAFSSVRARIGGNGRAESDVLAALVTPNFFEICREQALVGRMFGQAETGAIVAVLSYRLWAEQFGRSREIIGRGIRINGQLYTVVAVAPERFVFPESSDIWVTLLQSSGLPPPRVIRANGR